jgi:hypothetical protein
LKWARELETAGCKGVGEIPCKTDVVEERESKNSPRAITFLPGSESYRVVNLKSDECESRVEKPLTWRAIAEALGTIIAINDNRMLE